MLILMTVSAYNRPALPTLYSDDGDGFVVIAHRGASAYAPENTLVAFEKAFQMNAELIELDVMLSQDGVPVLFHDTELDRKSNGTGEVRNTTLEELKKLDVGSWFDENFAGESIPTLEEVLNWANGKISLNIELKTEGWREQLDESIEPRVVELVRKSGMQDHIIFSSFDYRILRRLKELAPDLRIAILYEPSQSGEKTPLELVQELQADVFNCSSTQLTDEWMRQLQEAGIPVLVYTVNEKNAMRLLIEAGVSGIFSDYPDLLRAIAEESQTTF